QSEEQELALADGVIFRELLAPESFEGGVLVCEKMSLGGYDASGRRGIVGTGIKEELVFDTVIGAVGAQVDTRLFTRNNIALTDKGYPAVNAAGESSVPGVYIAGDCKTGAATVVKAIAGGKAAAADILRKLNITADFSVDPCGPACADVSSDKFSGLFGMKGVISEAGKNNADACRCLSCNALCEICVDVCPNRANVAVEVMLRLPDTRSPALSRQIVHIDRMCNECGNCSEFCPHPGRPYKDKFTVFSCAQDFADSDNPGFLKTGADSCRIRLEDRSTVEYRRGDTNIPAAWIDMIETIEEKYGYLIR
ncbi:MAG: FAD-dependent oxidoreductase, partial [Treponema sp.]|nr:FAD-dependent oxidoreductase [Treponema sp.]